MLERSLMYIKNSNWTSIKPWGSPHLICSCLESKQLMKTAWDLLVQSLNSPFFPPHIGAEPGQAKRESRITCMRMLKTNQSKIASPLSIRVHTCSHQSVAQYLFQLARWKKKHFLLCWYCGKKTNWYVFYRGLYSYRQRLHVITLFSNIFSYCFCILNEFSKSFERKVWRVQVAHLHNAARALSSLSRCFQLWTNLDRNLFPYLLYCGQTNRMSFSAALVKFHWFGIMH